MNEELPSSEIGARTRALHGQVLDDVRDRQRWMDRQSTWYAMRHDGIRRRNKPWPHAADMHFPLADSIIRKKTPFYFNQLFATEVIAQFVAREPSVAPFAQEMGYWFDYKLKQESNLEREILIAIDKMQMAGQVTIKTFWDADENRLAFDAIEPTHCIVPDGTEDLQKADRITLVHHLSPDAYRRDKRFKLEDEAFIKRITGKRGEGDTTSDRLSQEKQLREGITHASKGADIIIVWEIWENTPESGWWVHWISPSEPEKPLRPSQGNPLSHKKVPIVRFDSELKDKGHYSSRGIPEMVAAFELSLCSTWNDKRDAMRLFNTPFYSSESLIPNAGNIRLIPGQIGPAGLKAMFSGNRPPFSFDEEMQNTRGVAENLVGTPDYGIGQNDNTSQPRTLGEVERIQQQTGVGIDLNARIFRMALRELLGLAWQTLVQYDKGTQYFVANEARQLPPEALQSGAWMVHPNGSSESWDKPKMLQKAIVRMQLFGPSQGFPQGMPWINQPALAKSVLELDDPRLVPIIFIDQNAKAQDEYEDEGRGIPAMLMGLPQTPKPEEDGAVRIKAIMDFIAAQDHQGIPIPPMGLATLRSRVQGMMQLLQQQNPQKAQQVQMDMAKAANVSQMPPQGAPQSQPQPEIAAA